MGTNCEKKQSFFQLPETLVELGSQLCQPVPPAGSVPGGLGPLEILGVGLPYRAVVGVPGTCREPCLPVCNFPG